MPDTVSKTEKPLPADQRAHSRHAVAWSCVQLEEGNGGVILNLCENGLAIRVARNLPRNRLLPMRFQASRSAAWIETMARVIWRSPSEKIAGLEFVDLSHEGRVLLKEWISSGTNLGDQQRMDETSEVPEIPAASAKKDSSPSTVEDSGEQFTGGDPRAGQVAPDSAKAISSSETIVAGQARGGNEPPVSAPDLGSFREHPNFGRLATLERAPDRHSGTARGIGYSLLVILVLAVLSFLGLHLKKQRNGRSDAQKPVLPVTSSTASEVVANTAQPDISPRSPLESSIKVENSLNAPGLALQVAAMRNKENADSLAQLLREKHFPVSIIRNGSSHLYRVAVGPYRRAAEEEQAKADLEKQGFSVILLEPNSVN